MSLRSAIALLSCRHTVPTAAAAAAAAAPASRRRTRLGPAAALGSETCGRQSTQSTRHHWQSAPKQQQQPHPHYEAFVRAMRTNSEAPAAGATGADVRDDAAAGHDDVVVVDGTRYRTAKEGLATIFVPLQGGDHKERQNGGGGPAVEDHPQQVFYNPIQQFNRDLSVLAIRAYGLGVIEQRQAAAARKRELAASKKRKRREAAAEAGTGAEAKTAAVAETSDAPAPTQTQAADGADERPAKIEKTSATQDAASAAAATTMASTEQGPKATGVADAAEAPGTVPETDPETAAAKQPSPIKILDALSATGLRALRYAHELPFGVSVTANDLLPAATESIRRNVALNGLQDTITVTQADALAHMYTVAARDLTARATAAVGTETDGSNGGARPKHQRHRNASEDTGRHASALYDVIDLDPYGTGATFFDAAIQAVRHDGGLLCVTCTDAGVWASQGYPEKCYALYGGVPMKGAHSHEAGLRLVLHALAASAARHGLALTPRLSLSIDFYCRVFVTVSRSPARVKFLAGRSMVAYNCDQGCGAWTTQPLLRTRTAPSKAKGKKGGRDNAANANADNADDFFYKYTFATGPQAAPRCDHCGTKTHLAGPMYAGPLHDAAFVRRILDDLPRVAADAPPGTYATTSRIRGMLQTALEELVESRRLGEDDEDDAAAGSAVDLDPDAAIDPVPFFFLPTNLAKALHCATPGEDALRGALLRLGYRVTRSHCRAGSIKTDAPWAVLWDVMRAWVRQKAPVARKNLNPNTAAYRLLRPTPEPRGGEGEAAAEGKGEGEVAANNAHAPDTPDTPDTSDTTTNAAGAVQAIVFDEALGRQHGGRAGEKKLVRYQLNPRENWGPMNRAKGK